MPKPDDQDRPKLIQSGVTDTISGFLGTQAMLPKSYFYTPEIMADHDILAKAHVENLRARLLRENYPEKSNQRNLLSMKTQLSADVARGLVNICFPDQPSSTIDICIPPDKTQTFKLTGSMKAIDWNSVEKWNELDDFEKARYINAVALFIAKRSDKALSDPFYIEKILGIAQGHIATILDVFNADFTYQKHSVNTASASETAAIEMISFKNGQTKMNLSTSLYVLTLKGNVEQFLYRTKDLKTGKFKEITTDNPEVLLAISKAFTQAKTSKNSDKIILNWKDNPVEIFPLANITASIEYTRGTPTIPADDRYEIEVTCYDDKLVPTNLELLRPAPDTTFFTPK